VSLRLHAPGAARTVTTVLTVSAGNDFIHTGFAWLSARANLEQVRAEAAADRS